MLTLFGTVAVTVMFLAYWLERRSKWFVAAFALGTALTSLYGFLVAAYPIAGVEAAWTLVALHRFRGRHRAEAQHGVSHRGAGG